MMLMMRKKGGPVEFMMVTAIINVSLSTGTVPKQFKQAVVPLLKKPGLDTLDLKRFRPVSTNAIYFKGS